MLEEIESEFTAEELQEFLEADTLPVQADPAFKEALRRRLWELVHSPLPDEGPKDPPAG